MKLFSSFFLSQTDVGFLSILLNLYCRHYFTHTRIYIYIQMHLKMCLSAATQRQQQQQKKKKQKIFITVARWGLITLREEGREKKSSKVYRRKCLETKKKNSFSY